MTISSIALENFKAFGSLELSIAPLTILTGLNGSGKSTVVQALAVLQQSGIDSTDSSGELIWNGELVQLGTLSDLLYEDHVLGDDARPRVRIAITGQGEVIDWMGSLDLSNNEIYSFTGDISRELSLSVFGERFQYVAADRSGPRLTYARNFSSRRGASRLGPRGEYSVEYLQRNLDADVRDDSRCHAASVGSGLLDHVNAWMAEVSPGVNLNVAPVAGTDDVRLDFGYGGTAGIGSSNRYRPTNVGFGLSYLLPVIVAILSAPPGSVLILENPEAHIHPRGQSVLGQFCARAAEAGVQLIVETHSDHFVNGVRLAVRRGTLAAEMTAIHFFDRVSPMGVDVHSPKLRSDGGLSFWPRGFFDEWENSLIDLLS